MLFKFIYCCYHRVEAQEPLIRDSPLPSTGQAQGQRFRTVSQEERDAITAAEEAVARELANKQKQSKLPSPPQMKSSNIVENIIAPTVQSKPPVPVIRSNPSPIANKPVSSPQEIITKSGTSIPPNVNRTLKRTVETIPASPAKTSPVTALTAASTPANVLPKKQLPAEELQELAEALQLLVKHRYSNLISYYI